MEEAALDIDRDFYEDLGKSDHKFAPYVKHIIARYYDDKIISWDHCKEVIDYVLNEEIPGDTKVKYLVDWHDYPKQPKVQDVLYNEKDM